MDGAFRWKVLSLFEWFHAHDHEIGMHNMQGSDEGTAYIIAGTIKGLVEEIRLHLGNAQLVRVAVQAVAHWLKAKED